MLALQKQLKFIKKIIKLPNGEFADVVFELIEVNGKIIAKAVSGKIIEAQSIVVKEEVLCLTGCSENTSFKPVASPFFENIEIILKDLSFITSQPARAPSF